MEFNLVCTLIGISSFIGILLNFSYKKTAQILGKLILFSTSVYSSYAFFVDISLESAAPLLSWFAAIFASIAIYLLVIPRLPIRSLLFGLWGSDKLPVCADKALFEGRKINLENADLAVQLPKERHTTPLMSGAIVISSPASAIASGDCLTTFKLMVIGFRYKVLDEATFRLYIQNTGANALDEAKVKEIISQELFNRYYKPPRAEDLSSTDNLANNPYCLEVIKNAAESVGFAFQISDSQKLGCSTIYIYKDLGLGFLAKLEVFSPNTYQEMHSDLQRFMNWYLSSIHIANISEFSSISPVCLDVCSINPPSVFDCKYPTEEEYQDFLRSAAEDPIKWYVFEGSELYRGWFKQQYKHLTIEYRRFRKAYIKRQLKEFRV